MSDSAMWATFILVLFSTQVLCQASETSGCSQFQNLEHLLEKLVRMEFKVEQLEKSINCSRCCEGESSNIKSLDAITSKLLQLDLKIKQLETKNNTPSAHKVIFSALIDNSISSLNSGDIIPFKDVQVNLGNGYSTSGVFTAPVSGTYYFQTSFLTSPSDELWVTIDLNGGTVGRANGKGHNTRHGTGTQTVIMDLAVGDKVSVKCAGGHNIYGSLYSSFSGFMIN